MYVGGFTNPDASKQIQPHSKKTKLIAKVLFAATVLLINTLFSELAAYENPLE